MGFHKVAQGQKIYKKTGFQFTSTAMLDFGYIYGEIVNIFRKITKKDINQIIKINHEHVNTRMAIRKRLMKTPKRLLTENKPIMDINVSLEKDFDGDIFSPLPFNTDLSHIVSLDKITNAFIRTFNEDKTKRNFEVAFTFRRVKLNIEINIIDDHRQKLLDVYQYWKTTRYPSRLYRKNIYMSFPLPEDAYMEYCDNYDLDPNEKYEAYRHIKKRTPYPIEFKKNKSTGNEDIFLMYKTYLDFTPRENNLSEGELKGSTMENFRLTRAFDVVTNIPSICFVRMNKEAIRETLGGRYEKLPSGDGMITANDVLEGWNRDYWYDEDENFQQIAEANYEFTRPEEEIDCKKLFYDDFEDFYKFLKEHEDHLVEDYIKIKYYKDNELNESKTFVIKKEDLVIKEDDADLDSMYRIAIYVALDYYNEWRKNFKAPEDIGEDI